MSECEMNNVLLGITGSVAAIKAEELIKELSPLVVLKVIVTENAKPFMPELSSLEAAYGIETFDDDREWRTWQKRGDPVVHIELRKWADIILIAPLTANTLAKISNGLSDNLLTSVIRAWDYNKPFLIAPAMNTLMYTHTLTERQLCFMQSLGAVIIPPISKKLMCGDIGQGAMAKIETIVDATLAYNEKQIQTSGDISMATLALCGITICFFIVYRGR